MLVVVLFDVVLVVMFMLVFMFICYSCYVVMEWLGLMVS